MRKGIKAQWNERTREPASAKASAGRQRDIGTVLHTLAKMFNNPGGMEIGNPYQTLVGVMLSARTRDEQVLKLLPGFFRAFPTAKMLARASTKEIEARINTIGMYRQKAKHLKGMAERLVGEHKGQVPKTMDALVALPGVGRKTASVLLAACFDTPAIAVDTHVHRVTNRLGWVRTKTPQQTEIALLDIVSKDVYRLVNRVFVKFGRYICIPGKPRCWMCPIQESCRYTLKNMIAPKNAEAIKTDILRREHALETLRQNAV